jgi:hypothetical protein
MDDGAGEVRLQKTTAMQPCIAVAPQDVVNSNVSIGKGE